MARITAAFGSSHSTMQFSRVENWHKLFDYIDRNVPIHDYEGNVHAFDDLLKTLPPDAAQKLAPKVMAERHAATFRAMDRLRADVQAADIDVMIIVGDDQREIFGDDCRPAIGIFYGETIRNPAKPVQPPPAEHWYRWDQIQRLEDGEDRHYPCHPALGTHLIQGLTAHGFDITAIQSLPPEKFEGHAYSFIHKRYIEGRTLPVVPIFLNTYFPPNQPTPGRCRELGRRIRELVASFPGDLKVGLMASGGLSHFMVNEDLDAKVIAAIRAKDMATLESLPVHWLESGSSEIRNWICVTEAAIDLGIDWIEYVPAYRSSALTGVGLCFARWS